MKNVVIFFLAVSLACGGQGERTPFKGDGLSGSGQCAGKLLIKPHKLTWETVYIQCRNVPYRILDFKQTENHLRAVYLLESHDPKCRFKIVVLYHAAPPKGELGGFEWNATGYGSWKGYKADNPADQLSCNLY